jgi:hypothetical protein
MASKLRRPPLFSYNDGSICLSSYTQYTACKVSELLHNNLALESKFLFSPSCFEGFDNLTCCHSELTRNNEFYREVVRILGRGSALLKAATYTEYINREISLHPCTEWESNPRSRCSSRRGHFVPHSTSLLLSGD